MLSLISCDKYNPNYFYVHEKFVVAEKGDYNGKYFLIRKVDYPDTVHYKTILGKDTIYAKLVLKKDTLFTVLTEQSYMYNKREKWDRFYFSFNQGDTIRFETIDKKIFWTKLNK